MEVRQMPFGLDTKSLVVGLALGLFVAPKVIKMVRR